MRLELGIIRVKDVQFGDTTAIEKGILRVNTAELTAIILQDNRFSSATVELARPGEKVRVIPIKDVVEPRYKVGSSDDYFPGIIGKIRTTGSGRTNVLRGATVMTVGRIVGYQEGFVDMSGPAAKYSPFSQTNNIALVLHPIEGLAPHAHEEAIRLAGLRASVYLGKATEGVSPDEVEVYELGHVTDRSLPRIAYIYTLLAEGLLHDTYVYGVDVKQILPTLIHPNEVLDGAVVSGNCVSACDKHTTYHHLNNPVINELYRRHGKDLNFVGVVITNLNVRLADKERATDYASKLVKIIEADGAIITEEGFGNPDTDLMMLCRKAEEQGIKTVLITDEYAGSDGSSQSLADAVPQADAVVSVGNANEVIALPLMDRVIGESKSAEAIAGGWVGCMGGNGVLNIEIQAIMGATCQLGLGKLTTRIQ
jgi:sarcosine reductase